MTQVQFSLLLNTSALLKNALTHYFNSSSVVVCGIELAYFEFNKKSANVPNTPAVKNPRISFNLYK
jgi:hypothetical protein